MKATHRWLSGLTVLLLVAALLPAGGPAAAQNTAEPQKVVVPGTLQSKLGCPGDWQPDCAKTFLTYDPVSDVWTGVYDLPAGSYQYKVALNKSWGENYGLNAKKDGANIPLKRSRTMMVPTSTRRPGLSSAA